MRATSSSSGPLPGLSILKFSASTTTSPTETRTTERAARSRASDGHAARGEFHGPHCVVTASTGTTALLVEPDVFHTPAVIDAVDHDGEPLHIGLPAGRAARGKAAGPGPRLRQLPFDLPYQPSALLRIGLDRLPVDQLVDLRVAVAGIIPLRTAHVVLVKLLIRVVDTGFTTADADCVVLARQLGKPLDGVDGFELDVDVDLLQLVDQDHGGIAVGGDVAGSEGNREAFGGPVAELPHDLASLGAVLGNIGIIARQRLQHLRRHAPHPFGRR